MKRLLKIEDKIFICGKNVFLLKKEGEKPGQSSIPVGGICLIVDSRPDDDGMFSLRVV